MGKIKKFAAIGIKKLAGGKDPVRIVEDFIGRLGFKPADCNKEKTADTARWMVDIAEGEELEVLVESIKTPHETTVYMGVNIATVPVRGSDEMLAVALEIADGLVGIKVSLVGHYLVLSSTLGVAGLTVDELDYHYRLISAQQTWFKDTLTEELQWERLPQD